MATMKAVVMHKPGGPEVLQIEQIPVPELKADEVLIRVKAFGLNRSEMFTRQGHSPGVKFPRVLGIEAVGIVEACPSGQFQPGQKVASCMGGMGREFDGGYAEFTCPKAENVKALGDTGLDWSIIGALPEMLQTAYGSLFSALKLQSSDRLLIRGGTTSVGLAASSLANSQGCFVAGTTRKQNEDTAELMKRSGVQQVLIDDGNIAEQVKGEKFDKVLELVGTVTVQDSLKCVKPGGIVCITGIVGNKWSLENFTPMGFIPHTVCLTVYSGGPADFRETPLDDLLQRIEAGSMHVGIGRVFHIDQIVEAHDIMEKDLARGKIVVLTS